MNGCAPHLNASRIEDDQLRDDQLRSAMEPGALTTVGLGRGEGSETHPHRQVEGGLERVLPEILPIDPRDPDVPSSQGAHSRRGSVLILRRVWAG
jgi:hypothetical protein